MSLITRMRRQRATYWAKTGVNKHGQNLYAAPVIVACRWDDTTEEFIGAKGTTEKSRAVVYPSVEMQPGDMLKKNAIEISDTVDQTNPKEFDAWEVLRFDVNPNIKNTENLLTAYL